MFDLFAYAPQAAFNQRHLLTLATWSQDEIFQTLSLALRLKRMQQLGQSHEWLKGKQLAMIFTKSSTRTRVSFEVGIRQLGGSGLFLSSNDIQIGRGETIADTARVLSRYVDGIMIRTFEQSDVEGLAEHGSVPVINGLTDDYHPCQVLADLLTFYEHKGGFAGRKLAFTGDGNNMAHSLMLGCAQVGMDVAIATHANYMPRADIVEKAKAIAAAHGSVVTVTEDPAEAVRDADAVYTDVFTSMGQEAETIERLKHLKPYMVTEKLFGHTKPDALFLHCLPAHRGEEVDAAVIDGPNSVVFDEAENRLHAQKAVMALLMR